MNQQRKGVKKQKEVIKKLKKDYIVKIMRFSHGGRVFLDINEGMARVPICKNPPPMKTIVRQIEKDINNKADENRWNLIGC